ncbi:MAG: hypothetical protein IJS14_02110 [Lentisphaeria bacterium]|nr:hypothetical protein [Lentisphaeria bacterium]
MYDKLKKLAEERHAGQFRKGEGRIPYIEHPKAVARMLLDWGEPEDSPAVGIAWGHDLLEDTPTAPEEILAASDETVAAGILLLTYMEDTPKRLYLQKIAASGSRDAILVKLADRMHNTKDSIPLEGKPHAIRYLHEADCVFEAARKFPQDAVLAKAVAAWRELDASLMR